MTIPTTPPYEVGPLMRLERERLVELLRGLDGEEWALPTPCPGWSVLDLVVHVVGTDLSWVSWHRDDHHGTPPPVGLDGGGFIAWLVQLQIEWVDAAQRVSPALAVELLGWLGGRLEETIAVRDQAATTATVSWASDALVPAWLDQVRELTERWIHHQQLLEALGHADDLRSDLADPVLQGLRWAHPYRLGRVQRPTGTAVVIHRRVRVVRRGRVPGRRRSATRSARRRGRAASTPAHPCATSRRRVDRHGGRRCGIARGPRTTRADGPHRDRRTIDQRRADACRHHVARRQGRRARRRRQPRPRGDAHLARRRARRRRRPRRRSTRRWRCGPCRPATSGGSSSTRRE